MQYLESSYSEKHIKMGKYEDLHTMILVEIVIYSKIMWKLSSVDRFTSTRITLLRNTLDSTTQIYGDLLVHGAVII